MPNQVFVSAQRASNQNNISTDGASPTTIVFNTEHYDNKSAYNTSTGIFTAPVSGYYLVNIQIHYLAVDASDMNFINTRVAGNSSSVIPQYSCVCQTLPSEYNHADTSASNRTTQASATQVMYIPASSTIKVECYINGGTAQTDVYGVGTAGLGSMIQIRLLG